MTQDSTSETLAQTEAEIQTLLAQFDSIAVRLKDARSRRLSLVGRAGRDIGAREWLRHHPPAPIARRLAEIARQLRALPEQFEQPLRRVAFLEEEIIRLGHNDNTARARQKLSIQIGDVKTGELADYYATLKALGDERNRLVKRCITEAWPELEPTTDAAVA